MNLNLTSTINFDHIADRQLRSDVIALCLKTGKPVLKLSTKDYVDNGMQHYVEEYGSAGLVNIAVFNILQHTITGWPGGKPNADDSTRPERALPYPKRVVVFSPHPDDDVISMGGTIRRLKQQGHDVHIAYETSGNIAVADEEVRLYMHFLRSFNEVFANGSDELIKRYADEVLGFIKRKQEGDFDSRDVLTVKGLIRRGEARNACGYNGVKKDHIHFLDLPFYESGKIEKLPMSERDVHIIQELLQPHGTHRKCTDAVLAAIDEEKKAGAEWLNECRVWMYRGAWSEWEIENIEMCVPMSPEELREKRNAILRHQSQMESAPFLGNDEPRIATVLRPNSTTTWAWPATRPWRPSLSISSEKSRTRHDVHVLYGLILFSWLGYRCRR